MKSAAAALLALSLAAVPARAADSFSPEQKAQVEQLVRDYIMKNPEIIEEAFEALQKKKDEEKRLSTANTLKESSAAIFDSKHNVVLGNPKGKRTIVEFFDYNCTYCKHAFPDMLGLLDQDKDLRFILKEFPVLGPGSVEAAQVASAINRIAPDKYFEFHKRLMASRGEANKARALEAAAAAGIDTARIAAEMAKPGADQGLEESFTLANGLGINGTPSYIIGDAVIPGAVGIDRLKAELATARR